MTDKKDRLRGVRPYQFQPGQSGNPNGRPKGSKNKTKLLAEGLIGNSAKKIVKKVIEMALAGNEPCLRMCMDRILPAQRAVDGQAMDKQQGVNIFIEAAKQAIPPVTISQETTQITVPEVTDVKYESVEK